MTRALLLGALALAGCGGDDRSLQVYAASSLRDVLPRVAESAAFSFAGSDELAAQIRQGAPADVFVSADERHARELARAGLLDRLRVVARNRLVIVAARDARVEISTLRDLTRPGVKLVLGDAGVPAGEYARQALARAGVDARANVVSFERDAKGVLAKVALGEADAGLVYATDVRAAGAGVRAIELPPELQPDIRYVAGIVADGAHEDEAARFLAKLAGAEGRRAFAAAGFEPA